MRLFTDEELVILGQAGKILASKRVELKRNWSWKINGSSIQRASNAIDSALRHYPDWAKLDREESVK